MLIRHDTKVVLGSSTTLLVIGSAKNIIIDELLKQLWLRVFLFEKRCSRFIPSSELSAFNRGAGLKQRISQDLFEVLAAAKEMSVKTDGLYNPFILPALQKVGYVKSLVAAHASDVTDNYSQRSVAPYDELELSDTWARIPYGTAIDLGGCGKGFIADKLAEVVEGNSWVSGYWLSFGGDIICKGLDSAGEPWKVGIEAAQQDSELIVGSAMTNGERTAVATSATTARTGTQDGVSWHHIINPKTLRPAISDLIGSSIMCRSAILADVLATCAIIEGSHKAQKYIKNYGVQGILLQLGKGEVRASGKIRALRRRKTV